MKKYTLYDYQDKMVNDTFEKLEVFNSVLNQSATGSGKTVIMSEFIKKWLLLNPNKKVLVSVHRDELVDQTSDTLAEFGIFNEKITSKSKPTWTADVYVGMTQTIWSRKISLDIGLLVIDEAHEQIHVKSFVLFENCKRVGFTATPIINKRITYYECNYCKKKHDSRVDCCYNEKADKWSAPVLMSETYESINIGPPIKQLIEEGALVDEVIYCYDYYADLNAKENDDYDENEIAEESIKHDQNVLDEYKEKALGKKTMIFTASTKQNISLVDTFSEYKIKSYDSVHNIGSERKEIVEWFKNTEGAILVSTGTFTTGFDVREVECIIVNRPTKSLSLFHQIVGRGARTVKEGIFKDHFILIDLGGNVARLGKWSDPIDWIKIFTIGLHPAKMKKEIIIQCDKCSFNWMGQSKEPCPDCGHINQVIKNELQPTLFGEEKELEMVQKKTMLISKIPMPDGKKIMEFVRRTTDNKNDYFNLLISKYVDLWKLNGIPKEKFELRKRLGTLRDKCMSYLKSRYAFCNSLQFGVPRTYEYLIGKIIDKLESIYK